MNLDDRARRAAQDLASKAGQANMPDVSVLRQRRLRPAWAFAAGAVAVAALVLVPLVLLGGPRDAEDPVVTNPTVTSTLVTPTTVAPSPPSTPPPGVADVTTFAIGDLADLVPSAVSPGRVAQFGWGDRAFELGLSDKGFGPCCFDVTAAGAAVVLDTANLRLIAASSDGGGRVIAQWDARDFVPDAMVVAPAPRDDVIFVLGQTNRPGRPHDLISLRLDGTVIERTETIIDSNVEMLVSAGSVWATDRSSERLGWVQLATDVGDLFDLGDQIVQDSLLLSDRSRMIVDYPPQDTGMVVMLQQFEGGSTRYEIDLGGDTWGHFALPVRDGILVWAATSDIGGDGSVGRVVALIDAEGNVVDGFTWQGAQWAETGPFGLTRLGPDGAIYDLYSVESGVLVRRLALAASGAFDALVTRAGGGRAIAYDDGTLWIAGPLQVADQRGEWAEILQVDVRSRDLVAIHEVPAPMNTLDASAGVVWMGRAGDGALPSNLVGRLDADAGSIEIADLGELSVRDVVATADGAWLLSWNGGDASDLAFVSGSDLVVDQIIPLPDGAQPQAIALRDGMLWIADFGGMVRRYDTTTAAFLDPVGVSIRAVDIVTIDDRFGSDYGIWIAGADGGVRKLLSDGSIVATESLPVEPITLAPGGTQGSVWAATARGAVYFLVEDVDMAEPPPPVLIEETDVSGVTAIAFDGGRLWILGDRLVTVEFGQ